MVAIDETFAIPDFDPDCGPVTKAQRLGQAEVHELGAALGEHDVAGLQVAVHDAGAMRLDERVGYFDGDFQDFVGRERLAGEAVVESLTFQILHDEVVDVALRTDVIEHTDIGMLQSGNGFGFALKAGAQFRIRAEMGRKNFDGDRAFEAGIAGAIHLAHATCA